MYFYADKKYYTKNPANCVPFVLRLFSAVSVVCIHGYDCVSIDFYNFRYFIEFCWTRTISVWLELILIIYWLLCNETLKKSFFNHNILRSSKGIDLCEVVGSCFIEIGNCTEKVLRIDQMAQHKPKPIMAKNTTYIKSLWLIIMDYGWSSILFSLADLVWSLITSKKKKIWPFHFYVHPLVGRRHITHKVWISFLAWKKYYFLEQWDRNK